MKTIIVPVDLTKTSKNSAEVAIDIARKFDSKIIYTYAHNVRYVPSMAAHLSSISGPPIYETIAQQELMKQRLTDFVAAIDGTNSLNYKNQVGIGTIEDVVCGLIEKENAELVILGPHGESYLESFLLGKMDEKISRKAPCSVMVIPDGLKAVIFDNVGLALDTDWSENETQMDMFFEFLRAYNSKLSIVHIAADAENDLVEKQVTEHYGRFLNNLNHSFHTVYEQDVKMGITKFLKEQSTDLLGLVYREHGFFKRLFDPGIRKEMISETETPLLVLK